MSKNGVHGIRFYVQSRSTKKCIWKRLITCNLSSALRSFRERPRLTWACRWTLPEYRTTCERCCPSWCPSWERADQTCWRCTTPARQCPELRIPRRTSLVGCLSWRISTGCCRRPRWTRFRPAWPRWTRWSWTWRWRRGTGEDKTTRLVKSWTPKSQLSNEKSIKTDALKTKIFWFLSPRQ